MYALGTSPRGGGKGGEPPANACAGAVGIDASLRPLGFVLAEKYVSNRRGGHWPSAFCGNITDYAADRFPFLAVYAPCFSLYFSPPFAVPHPSRLWRATFPPGEGFAACRRWQWRDCYSGGYSTPLGVARFGAEKVTHWPTDSPRPSLCSATPLINARARVNRRYDTEQSKAVTISNAPAHALSTATGR